MAKILRKLTKEEKDYIKKCRDKVKGANFALLYGGGVKTLASALAKADESLTNADSLKLAKKLIEIKKGKKDDDGNFYGGADSVAYNAMYSIARSHTPTLPGLGTKISEALRPAKVGDQYITGRTNFCIQASGAEMLSTIVVTLTALAKRYDVEAYYAVSIHDK